LAFGGRRVIHPPGSFLHRVSTEHECATIKSSTPSGQLDPTITSIVPRFAPPLRTASPFGTFVLGRSQE
jgi:hypothetical protein